MVTRVFEMSHCTPLHLPEGALIRLDREVSGWSVACQGGDHELSPN